jgi:hypothetical protein
MKTRMWTGLGACTLILCAATALTAQIRGPVPGFVFDRDTREARPILGIAGAAHLGDPVALHSEVAAVSPDGAMALVAREDGVDLLSLDSGQAIRIEGGMAAVDRFAWSRDGATAAAYSKTGRQVQILRSLRTSPAAEGSRDVSEIGGELSALAVSGSRAVLGMTGGLWIAGADSLERIADVSNPLDIEISRGGQDLFVAESARIIEIRDFGGTASLLPFAESEDLVGIQLSAAGDRLWAASARGVEVYDLSTRASVAHLDLDFSPTRMEAAGRLALLNRAKGAEPLYVLDENLTVSFVPAGREQ